MIVRIPLFVLLVAAVTVFACTRTGSYIDPTVGGECRGCTTDELRALCTDGKDNDGNHLTDCEDPACRDVARCAAVIGPEDNVGACSDGVDNDGNGYIDCVDRSCVTTEACKSKEKGDENTNGACADGLDNDWNGYIDCGDRSCQIDAVSISEETNAYCSDGKDNDGNGFTDCSDHSCSKNTAITVCK